MLRNRDLIPWGFGDAENTAGVNPIVSLQKEMDRMFDSFFKGTNLVADSAANEGKILLTPRINISETDKEYQVSAEVPGVDEKDIEVKLTNGVLTVKGEKKAESEEKGKDFHRVERSYGSFSRAIRLPEDADASKVEAKYKKGVLSISVQKKPEAKAQSKSIEVKVED